MESGTLLHDRYRIRETLAKGRPAVTFLAEDEQTGQMCVVKQLSVSRAYRDSASFIGTVLGSEAEKIIELFDREGRVLAHLDHARVPDLIDHFKVATDNDTYFYLVQQYIDAPNLDELTSAGKHFTEREALKIALEVAEVLEYLHDRSPPIIHRDIKPSNILYDEETGAYLVDFGTVKDRLAQHQLDGATVVGTFDFMPLEQHQGNAVPESDIYSLGMTLICLLSHLDPSDMGWSGSRLDFRPHVHVSDQFADVLAKMVEPAAAGRYRTSAELKRDLLKVPEGESQLGLDKVVLDVVAAIKGKSPLSEQAVKYIVIVGIVGIVGLGKICSPDFGRAVSSQPAVVAHDGVLRIDIHRDFQYVDEGFPMDLGEEWGEAGGLATKPLEELSDEPDYQSSQVFYGSLPLGNGPDSLVSFALEKFWFVHVDRNNNEDLTDDGPPLQITTNYNEWIVSLAVDLVESSGNRIQTPYKLLLKFNAPAKRMYFTEELLPAFSVRCHYRGTVDLDGSVFVAIAYDALGPNGMYAEDGIWIDLDGNRSLERETEYYLHGDTLRVGSNEYRIDLIHP